MTEEQIVQKTPESPDVKSPNAKDLDLIKTYATEIVMSSKGKRSIHILYSLGIIQIGNMSNKGSFESNGSVKTNTLSNDLEKAFDNVFKWVVLNVAAKKKTLMIRYQKKGDMLTLFGLNQCTVSSIILQR